MHRKPFGDQLLPTPRPETEVMRLQRQIVTLQAQCDHDFAMLEPLILTESLVSGVYIIGEAERTLGYYRVECVHCNLQQEWWSGSRCPNCFGKMSQGKFHADTERYYGAEAEWSYYAAVVHTCENEDFAVVRQEWDQ